MTTNNGAANMKPLTANEWLALVGRTYRRARALQKHMDELATVSGNPALKNIGARVWEIAERYVDQQSERIA